MTKKTVLLVDDNAATHKAALEALGYNVITALEVDGEEGG